MKSLCQVNTSFFVPNTSIDDDFPKNVRKTLKQLKGSLVKTILHD